MNSHSRRSSSETREGVITWAVYLKALGDVMFNIDPVLMALPPRQSPVTAPHHTIHLQVFIFFPMSPAALAPVHEDALEINRVWGYPKP